MMTSAERVFALHQLDLSRERLLRAVHGLSSQQLLFRPEPGRWSIAENIEHLVVVERYLVGAIEKLLLEPPDLSKRPALEDAQVIAKVGTVVDRVQAPPRALPASRWPIEELLREFQTARQRTCDFVSTADGDVRRHFIPHFVFGDLDCYQWFLLIGAHCHRHTTQSEAVKAFPAFPQ
jgi:hypothetical protein